MDVGAHSLNRWLRTRNWPALIEHFSQHSPRDADEFSARALLAIHRGDGHIDWKSVIADLREACRLRPADALLAGNLVQALLDSGQTEEAYAASLRLKGSHAGTFPAAEKLALAAAATQRWEEASSALLQARTLAGAAPLPEALARLQDDLSTRWWQPLMLGNIRLRRPDHADREFLRTTFSNATFLRHYHRFQEGDAAAIEAFISKARLSPRQTRRLDWIITDAGGTRHGLAAIVDIDWSNARGELLVGLPGAKRWSVALKTSVALLDFGFNRLRLEKMLSYVYGDNPAAQANTLHLGFQQEGLLREHLAIPGTRLDLYVNGMTRADFAGSKLLSRLVRTWPPRQSD